MGYSNFAEVGSLFLCSGHGRRLLTRNFISNFGVRVQYQVELWPAACEAQGWNPKDEFCRRDNRSACWAAIGRPDKCEEMPLNHDETTALFTYLRHLADPNNINRSMAWDNCKADYVAFNKSKQSDHWQALSGRRSLFYRGRQTAAGNPLDDPLDRKASHHRLIRMRASVRKGRAVAPSPSIDPHLYPF